MFLQEAVQKKAARISSLKAAKEKYDQQQAINRETAQVLYEWNSRSAPVVTRKPYQPPGKDV